MVCTERIEVAVIWSDGRMELATLREVVRSAVGSVTSKVADHPIVSRARAAPRRTLLDRPLPYPPHPPQPPLNVLHMPDRRATSDVPSNPVGSPLITVQTHLI